MTTSSWTPDDLRALEGAIASGARRVKYADREVEYRTLADMLALRDLMRSHLGDPNASAPVTWRPVFSKGTEE
jgi:hypothetical protein